MYSSETTDYFTSAGVFYYGGPVVNRTKYLLVKITKCVGFGVHRRSYLICPPVIEAQSDPAVPV